MEPNIINRTGHRKLWCFVGGGEGGEEINTKIIYNIRDADVSSASPTSQQISRLLVV